MNKAQVMIVLLTLRQNPLEEEPCSPIPGILTENKIHALVNEFLIVCFFDVADQLIQRAVNFFAFINDSVFVEVQGNDDQAIFYFPCLYIVDKPQVIK